MIPFYGSPVKKRSHWTPFYVKKQGMTEGSDLAHTPLPQQNHISHPGMFYAHSFTPLLSRISKGYAIFIPDRRDQTAAGGCSIGLSSPHSYGEAFYSVTCSQRKYLPVCVSRPTALPRGLLMARCCSLYSNGNVFAHPPSGSAYTERVCSSYSLVTLYYVPTKANWNKNVKTS